MLRALHVRTSATLEASADFSIGTQLEQSATSGACLTEYV